MKKDVYSIITDRIIKDMEKGIIPWRKPWVAMGGEVARNWKNKKPYKLINQFLLEEPGEYITLRQIADENARLQKKNGDYKTVFCKLKEGEEKKGHIVLGWFPKKIEPSQKEREHAEKEGITLPQKTRLTPRYYLVYHINQCEGIESKLKPVTLPDGVTPNEMAESIINNYIDREHITVNYIEGDSAYYMPSADTIVLPIKQQFAETAECYGTAFHEMTHSTGHSSRLNRLEKKAAFGNEEYSKEELIAEIGSAALVHKCGMETESSAKNNSAYIQSWLKVLKNDKKCIINAATQAEKAVNFILGEKEKGE